MNAINRNIVNHLVLRKQHLTENTKEEDVHQIVEDVGGLHATNPKSPYLSLFSRTRQFTRDALDEALYEKRSLGKIRCMRKTVYVLTKTMMPIAYAATKGMVEPASERYSKYLGVSQQEYRTLSSRILSLLKGRGRTAQEIKKELGTDQSVSSVLNLMCDQGLLVRGKPRGGWRSNLHTYALFHDYFPDVDLTELREEQAITRLVRQYMQSYGPVTEKDVIWWTGLTKTPIQDALKKLKQQPIPVAVHDLNGEFMTLPSDLARMKKLRPPKKRVVNLLPSLDPFLMGYKERERYLSLDHYDKVFDRSGNATSTILVDGRVVGVWDCLEKEGPLLKLFLFEEVDESVLKDVSFKAQQIGRFIAEKRVRVKECGSMTPLTRRTAGGVMSPLKDC